MQELQTIRSTIKSLITQIQPLDKKESDHIAFVENWIESGSEIFRTTKPATPDPHLVSYFLLIDQKKHQILLVDHKKANLWLPAGGHVEPNEHPKDTVTRELQEELGVKANFISNKPFFLTVSQTRGDINKHTDVSLWYLLKSDTKTPLSFDKKEFHTIKWFSPKNIPLQKSEPHMSRLLQKLSIHNIFL